MLKIFELKSSKVEAKNVKNKDKNKEINYSRHFPSSTREWNNSIYVYNKNSLNLIPSASSLALNIIKSYFNLYNFKRERRIRKNKLFRRLRRLSSHKIYVSNGEFKHTNDKVIITLYLFNRQRHNYIIKFRKKYFKILYWYRRKLINRFNLFQNKVLKYLNKSNLLVKTLPSESSIENIHFLKNFYKKIVKKSFKKLKRYLLYKQLIYINESKYNFTYLQDLKTILEKIFNKNVEFNLINLKYFYLNSDILYESISLKIKKNRRNLLRYLNKFKNKVKTKNLNLLSKPVKDRRLNLNNILRKNLRNINKEKLSRYTVFNNIKYMNVSGVRIEAKGRLTRRYTASKSISKLRYKGNLINTESLYKISSVLLRGNLKANLQYTKLKSKTRIGSFGIKGWISGN